MPILNSTPSSRTPFVPLMALVLVLSFLLLQIYTLHFFIKAGKTESQQISKHENIWAHDMEEEPSLRIIKKSTPFHWDMLEPSIPGICGHHKCFFRAKEDPEKIGFAISSYHPNTMQWAWLQAEKLKEYYGVDHIYLEPPQGVKVSTGLTQIFTDRRKQVFEEEKMHLDLKVEEFIHLTELGGNKTEPESRITVQKLHVVPSPFLEIGHGDNSPGKVQEDWPSFRKSIQNKLNFSKRLLQEEQKLELILQKEPWLKQNFQILLDNTGRIIQFDLDRGYYSSAGDLFYKDMSKYFVWIWNIAKDIRRDEDINN